MQLKTKLNLPVDTAEGEEELEVLFKIQTGKCRLLLVDNTDKHATVIVILVNVELSRQKIAFSDENVTCKATSSMTCHFSIFLVI